MGDGPAGDRPAPALDDATFRLRWDGDHLRPRERLDGYLDRVEKSLLCSSLTPADPAQFRANLEEARFANGRAVRFVSSPHHTSRLEAEVARTSEDTIVVGMHLSDGVRVQAGSLSVDRSHGDLVAIESTTQFSLETRPAAHFSMLSLFFSGARIDRLTGKRRAPVWTLLQQQPSAATLKGCVALFSRRFSESAGFDELSALHRACEALVAATFIQDQDFLPACVDANAAARSGILMSICDYVVGHLKDPSLSPRHVAVRFGISVRYVHKIFEAEGQTFSAFVLDRRLDAIRRHILGTDRGTSMAKIAAEWGLPNQASFHRNYRRRFDMTPRQSRVTRDRD